MAEQVLARSLFRRLSAQSLRRQRVFRDRSNVFELPHEKFISLFRLSKDLAQELCDALGELRPHSVQSTALSVETKVLIALHFFAVGCYQQAVGQDLTLAVTQGTVSSCIFVVTNAILRVLFREKINFPRTPEEQLPIKMGFYSYAKFPGVIGAIDCTPVAIVAPKENEEQFVSRKGYHCLIVQLVCDADLRILNVNASFPGSTHDSHIWKNSDLHKAMEFDYHNNKRNSWLLGDSGYPLEPWLLTPVVYPPEGSPASKYNKAHCRARNVIERCNGVLKQRFRCLLRHRVLHYPPQRAAKIIIACCILHNMCINARLPPPPEIEEHSSAEGADPSDNVSSSQQHSSCRAAGQQTRDGVIRHNFY